MLNLLSELAVLPLRIGDGRDVFKDLNKNLSNALDDPMQNRVPRSRAETPSNLPKSPHIRRRQSLNHTSAVHKPRPEDAVGIAEHAVLQTDDNELAALEPSADETTNILRV